MILTEVKSDNTQEDSLRLYEKTTRLPTLSTKIVQFPMLFASVFFGVAFFFPFFRFLGCFLPERHEAGATASLGALLPTPRHRQRRQPRDLRHVRGRLDVVLGRVDVVLPRRHATSGATRTSTSTVPMAQMSQMSERGEKLRDRRSRIRHRAHRMT